MRHPFTQFLFLVVVILAETTLLKGLSISGVRPDLYLVCLIFLAYSQGSFYGVLIGFCSGLLLDFVSIAPLGFHAFSMSIIAFGLGSLRGKLFVDPIFMPILLAVGVTLLNWLLAAFLISIFGIDPGRRLLSADLWLQFGFNALVAPVLYGVLRLVGAIPQYLREEER